MIVVAIASHDECFACEAIKSRSSELLKVVVAVVVAVVIVVVIAVLVVVVVVVVVVVAVVASPTNASLLDRIVRHATYGSEIAATLY